MLALVSCISASSTSVVYSFSRALKRVEPTDQWEQVELLYALPEQRDYLARGPRQSPALQQALFAYAETL
jgi:hypothetical protein